MGHYSPIPTSTLLYSSLQGADKYPITSIHQDPHGGVTKGGLSITTQSQVHATTAALVGRESKLPGEEWLSCLERVYPGLQSGRCLFQAGER